MSKTASRSSGKSIEASGPGRRRIFLLSPANLAGRRAQILLRPAAAFELAVRLRSDNASLGEIFSFVSGLYFRGKLAYARAFSEADRARQSVFVITAGHGLVSPDETVSLERVAQMAEVSIDSAEPRYRNPLERDSWQLASQIGETDEVVLLGSIATRKYLEPLLAAFGDQLKIPMDFIGRGDMSRGSLLLKAVRAGTELDYIPARNLEHKSRSKRPKQSGSR